MTMADVLAGSACVLTSIGLVYSIINLVKVKAELSVLERICDESYQVVGVLSYMLGGANAEKALDNLSQKRIVHEDVLPFVPRHDLEVAMNDEDVDG